MTIKPLQTSVFPKVGSQQAATLPMQATVVPAQSTTSGIDITTLMNLMITMMIVMMMMKMMTGAIANIGGSGSRAAVRY